MIDIANLYAKLKYKKSNWNPLKKKYDYIPDGIKQSSLYFFVWTQHERKIRESMMSCFANPCHQVHDAIYSMEQIKPHVIEAKVLQYTGFAVKIFKE